MVKDLFHLRHKVSGVKAKGAGNALKGMQEWECSKKVERGEGGEAGVAGDAQGWRCSAVQGRRCCSSQPKMHFPLARKWHSRKNLKGNGAGAKCKLSRKQLQQKCRGGSVCRIDGTLLSFSALPPLLSSPCLLLLLLQFLSASICTLPPFQICLSCPSVHKHYHQLICWM